MNERGECGGLVWNTWNTGENYGVPVQTRINKGLDTWNTWNTIENTFL